MSRNSVAVGKLIYDQRKRSTLDFVGLEFE